MNREEMRDEARKFAAQEYGRQNYKRLYRMHLAKTAAKIAVGAAILLWLMSHIVKG